MKKDVMTLAWQFVKKLGMTISDALKQAWKVIKLRIKMVLGKVRFQFRKLNGEIREAYGTLKQGLIPEVKEGKNNPDVQTYYDLDKESWRCFRKELLIS